MCNAFVTSRILKATFCTKHQTQKIIARFDSSHSDKCNFQSGKDGEGNRVSIALKIGKKLHGLKAWRSIEYNYSIGFH